MDEAEQHRSRWEGRPTNVRLAAFGEIYVKHEAIKAIDKYLGMELVIRQVDGKPSGLLVIAAPGTGKTSLTDYLKRSFPGVASSTLTTQPVVAFSVPSAPNPSAMGTALLKALGDPLPERGTSNAKLDRIQRLLAVLKVIIICIDNFQDVPANRKSRGMAQIADWVRDLCDLAFPGVVIALGTDEATIVRDAHEQLRRRMQARIDLPSFGLESKEQRATFRTLLMAIDKALPLAEASDLSAPRMAARIQMATGGNFDYLMKLLQKGLVNAVARGSERIEMTDLETAFQQQHQVSAIGGNPFSDDYDGKPLTRPGQIFHRPSQAGQAGQGQGDQP